MFLDHKNAVFASQKIRFLLTLSLSTHYKTPIFDRFADRKDSW